MAISGDNRANTIIGNGYGNVIHGRGGNDRIDGRYGDDALYGDYGADILWGGKGNDRLFGGPGDDQLVGGIGNDRLEGGLGQDDYWGGGGFDRFVMSGVPGNGSTNEIIHDYQAGEVVDFSAIDADWTRPGNQAFIFVRSGDFTGRPGELITDLIGTGENLQTRIYVDTDGNALADLFVTIENGWYGFQAGENLIL